MEDSVPNLSMSCRFNSAGGKHERGERTRGLVGGVTMARRSNIRFTDEAEPRESTEIHLKYHDPLVDDYLLGSRIYVGHLPILIRY